MSEQDKQIKQEADENHSFHQVDEQVSHQQRHVILHKNLDELVADFITHTHKLPSKTILMELMEWSNKQQIYPEE